MKLSDNSMICNDCGRLIDCNKQCAMHTGKSIYNFLNNIDFERTSIGEMNKSYKSSTYDLITVGHQIYNTTSTASKLLKADLHLSINIGNKLKDAFTYSANQLLRNYLKEDRIEKEEAEEIRSRIQQFNRNTLVVCPIRPGTKCTIVNDSSDNKDCELISVKFIVDDSGEIKQELIFSKQVFGTKKTITMNIEDYMHTFTITDYSMMIKNSKFDDRVIKMSRYGVIHPLSFVSDKKKLSVDGTYIYYTSDGTNRIIGYWEDNKVMPIGNTMDSLKDTKLFKKFKNNMGFIAKHRNFIAPYLTFEENTIICY